MTDYRTELQALVTAYDEHGGRWPQHHEDALFNAVKRARTALAEPVAEPPAVAKRPSDEELGLIYHDCCRGCEFMDQVGFEDAARAVLARWGQPPAPPAEIGYLLFELRAQSELQRVMGYGAGADALTRAAELLERHAAPVPVPVAERLPGPEDCDAGGRCWIYMPDIGTAPSWRLVDPREIGPYHTHWLPASALPLPAPQGGEVEP